MVRILGRIALVLGYLGFAVAVAAMLLSIWGVTEWFGLGFKVFVTGWILGMAFGSVGAWYSV